MVWKIAHLKEKFIIYQFSLGKLFQILFVLMKIELKVYWMKLNPSSPAISNSQTATLGSKFIQWKDVLLLSQSQRIWYWRITDIISFQLIWLLIMYLMKKDQKMNLEFSTSTMRLPHLAANWRAFSNLCRLLSST